MRLTSILSVLASANIFLAFIYQWFVITTIGPGKETDALFAGMVIPQVVLAVVSGSLSHVLVPLLSSKEGNKFSIAAWSFFQGIGLIFGGIAFLLYVTASIWVPCTVPGFDIETSSLTVFLVRIQLLGMVFIALTTVLWSVNNSRQKFVWVEISSILATLIGLGFLIWGLPRFGVAAAAWAMVVKAILQTIFLLRGLGPYHQIDWSSDTVKEAWRRIHPLLLGTMYYKTDRLLDRILASMAPSGGLTLLHLAQQLYGAGNTVLNKAIATPMVPLLAQKAHAVEWQSFYRIFFKRLLVMLGITGIVLLTIMIVGKPILACVFGPKRFNNEDIASLWWLLIALAGVLMGGAMGQVLSSSFYAQGNTSTPTKIGVFGFTLGLGFKIIGFYWWGIIGIAIGTSLYYFINVILLHIFFIKGMRRKNIPVLELS